MKDQEKARAGILKLEGNQVSVKDSSFTNLSMDPIGHQTFFESNEADFAGSSFAWVSSPVSNCKDINLLTEEPTQSSQLFKISQDSVEVSNSAFTEIEATSGFAAESLASMKFDTVELKQLKLRKGVMSLQGDNVIMTGVTVEGVEVHPLA